MASCYVPLRSRSNGSLLKGASPPGAYVEAAAEWRLPAIALADDNLLCAVPFFEAARAAGVRPVLGATLWEGPGGAAAFVENAEGYANLCTLLTRRDLEEGLDPAAALREHAEGLVLLTEAPGLAAAVREAFPGRLFLALRPGGPDPAARDPALRDLPRAAAPEAFFARGEDHAVHRLLCAVRHGTTLAELRPGQAAGPEAHLLSPAEARAAFRDAPEALQNTLAVAERCTFDLLDRKPVFPRTAGAEAPLLLREHAFAGARARYGGKIPPAVRRRLEEELRTIIAMGFADYFLVVEEIVRHARSLGTLTAGRGSGAGSLTAYVLRITNVDPLAFDLPFERFLNEGRADYPDLDVDFCRRLRDRVIDFVFDRFGHDHTAMIAACATFQPRLAFREAAKAFGFSEGAVTRIAGALARGVSRRRFHTLVPDPALLEAALDLARRIQGFPRHLSVHCGGVVITPDPVRRHAPLLRAEKGVVITVYDKDAVERVGLVKIDLLGNRTLSTVAEAAALAELRAGRPVDPEALPDQDPETFALVRAGRTVGCGQLESPAMRHLLVQMKPSCVRHLMQALALVRPGAAGEGAKEVFLRRRRGIEPEPVLSPALARVLAEAHGVMLYEDDVLRVACAASGIAPAEADRLRRAVLGKAGIPSGEAARLRARFLEGCDRTGFGRAAGARLLRRFEKFKGYGFCRAHAASYAVLAYAAAYLKTHHPAAFWTAALNHNAGMYPRWVLVEEAKRAGVAVRPPCVNRSGPEFTLEEEGIRAGLSAVAGLSHGTVERILAAAPFASHEDLAARVRPGREELERLVRCGALDFTGLPRRRLLWWIYTAYARKRPPAARAAEAGPPLFGRIPAAPAVRAAASAPPLPPMPPEEQWKDEWELMGFTCGPHPLAGMRADLEKRGVTKSTALPRRAGRTVRLAGVIAAARRVRTTRGEVMQFLTLDDEAGVFEAVLFPDAWRRYRRLLDGPGPYLVEGTVEDRFGALAVTVERLQRLQTCESGPARW